jgi:hypothetical protein
MGDKYIGISEDRLHHIIGVARKCYSIAKEEGFSEGFCKKMFMVGRNHDVGYEFAEYQKDHPRESESMCMLLHNTGELDPGIIAIGNHGCINDINSDELRILNTADMLIDGKGNEVTAEERLKDIAQRYGFYSEQYETCKKLCQKLGIL